MKNSTQNINRQYDARLANLERISRNQDFKRYLYVYSLLEDVPWEEDESAAFDADADSMRKTVELGLSRRGEPPMHIPYKSSTWVIEDVSFQFNPFPEELYNKARKFVLYEIIRKDWRALSTVQAHLKNIVRFMKKYLEKNGHISFNYIHSDDIISFMEDWDIPLCSKKNIMGAIVLFYEFVLKNYTKEHILVDLGMLHDYLECLEKQYYQTRTVVKHSDIPDAIFYPMHFTMISLIRDSTVSLSKRITAAMVLLLMWTGLRPAALRNLRRGYLIKHEEEGKILHFYEYISSKNENDVLFFMLFPPALEALTFLEEAQRELDENGLSDYLISYDRKHGNRPATYDTTRNKYAALMCSYLKEELSIPRPGLKKCTYKGKAFYLPSFYCFRVHLCTYLQNHGFDSRWVEGHLAHLSKSIGGTYYRVKASQRNEVHSSIRKHVPEITCRIKELSEELTEQTQEPSSGRSSNIREETIGAHPKKHPLFDSIINDWKNNE